MSAEISKRPAWSPLTAPVREDRTFQRVLVAVGEDQASMAAVQVAGEIAVRVDGEVLAVHVEVADVPCCGPSAEACGLRDLDTALDQALLHLRRAGVRHRGERWRAPSHRVVDSLIRAADEYGADLLVIHSRRRTGLRGMLHRDLGLQVAKRVACPVLLVP